MALPVPRVEARPPPPTPHAPINLLLARFAELAGRGGCRLSGEIGTFLVGDSAYSIPRVIFQAADDRKPLRIGIFTGLRGNLDGGFALLHFLDSLQERPWRAAGYELSLYPLCNPTGHEDGRQTSRRCAALDSGFWQDSPEPEIMLIERELHERDFSGVVTLHTDDRFQVPTGSARGGRIAKRLLEAGLAFGGAVFGEEALALPWPAGALSTPQGARGALSLRLGVPQGAAARTRIATLDAALGAVLSSARHYLDPQ